MGEFLGDHAEVHRRNRGIALAGAIDPVLADEDERVGDAIERDGEAAAVPPEALLEVLQFVVMLLKTRNKGSFLRAQNHPNAIQFAALDHRPQTRGPNLSPTAPPEDNPIEPR